MPDPYTITTSVLTSIKTAMEITNKVRQSEDALEASELKFKMSGLIDSLVDAKIQISQIQEAVQEKDKRIAELEEAFENKDSLVRPRHYDAYYEINDKGLPVGIAYCLNCWDNDHVQRQLVSDPEKRLKAFCTRCTNSYDGRLTGYIDAADSEKFA